MNNLFSRFKRPDPAPVEPNKQPIIKQPINDEEEIARLTQQLEELKHQEEQEKDNLIKNISYTLPNEEKGKKLLDAFLTGQAFDHKCFAMQPIKEAFLSASLKTIDAEIICCCFLLVRSTMTSTGFLKLIDQNPRFKQAYQSFFKDTLYIHSKGYIKMPKPQRINLLKQTLPKAAGSHSLLQYVIQDEIARVEDEDKMAGIEDVDLKWFNLLEKLTSKKDFSQLPKDFFASKKSFFSPNWTKNIDPFQGAIMVHYWGCDKNHEIIKQFTALVKNPNEKQELIERGLL